MKALRRILFLLIGLIVLAGIIAYADGNSLPVDHTVSVTGAVPAPPQKVFALITNVADGAHWRHSVKSVKVLPSDAGRDHWIEDLGHGQTMNFLATRTDFLTRRDVLLTVPGAASKSPKPASSIPRPTVLPWPTSSAPPATSTST